MGNKTKLFWIGDSPAVTTGFGRVSQGVLEGLLRTGKYEISVLGINHPIGDPHRYEGLIRIYPARTTGNLYGFNRVEEIIRKEKPDVIIINNDLWIVKEYLSHMPEGQKVIIYSPVDALPVQEEWLRVIREVGAQVTAYTEFGKKAIEQVYPHSIKIIGHGVDTDEFYPMEDARHLLQNIPDELFIVQNVNRNQPRKRLDLFLKAMSVWLERKSPSDRKNIAFYYHGVLNDVGWNLVSLSQRWGIDDKLYITDQSDMTAAEGVTIQNLCKVYNCADVQVMTSMGEGFGLSPFESAACGVAQIVPNHSACKELWTGYAPLIDVDHWDVLTGGVNTEGGVISIEHLVEILDELYFDRIKLAEYAKTAYKYTQREEFTWDYIANQFDSLVVETLNSSLTSQKYES